MSYTCIVIIINCLARNKTIKWDLTRDKQTLLHGDNKGADQPAHPRSLISAFVVRFLESLMIPLAIRKIPMFLLVSEAEQSGLSFTMYLVANHEDRFSRDAAQAQPCYLKKVLVT